MSLKRMMNGCVRGTGLLIGCASAWLLQAGGNVAWLGVSVEPVPEAVRHQVELPRGAGLTVREVAPDGPAEKAGLRRFDILLRLEDQWLYEPGQLSRLVRSYEPGAKVQVLYLRRGERRETQVTLGERPAEVGGAEPAGEWPRSAFPPPFGPDFQRWLKWFTPPQPPMPGFDWSGGAFLGVVLADPGPEVLEPLNRSEEEGGALVREVLPDSPARKAGIRENDLIIALDGKPVRSSRAMVEALRKRHPGERVELTLLRNGAETRLEVELGRRPGASVFPGTPPRIMVFPRIEWGPGPAGDSDEEKRQPDQAERGSQPDKDQARTKVEVRVEGVGGRGAPRRQAVVTRSDEAGQVIVSETDGRRHVCIRDAEGKTVFEGDVAEGEEPELPAEWRERYRKAVRLLKDPPAANQEQLLRKLRLPALPPEPGFIRQPAPKPAGLPADGRWGGRA